MDVQLIPILLNFMHYTLENIREACFNLCSSLMWEKDRLTTDELELYVHEFDEMTEKFFEIANHHLDILNPLENRTEILIRAIDYLENVHSFPPLRGNHQWFHDSLSILVEIIHPNSRVKKSNIKFFGYLENGIKKSKEDPIEDDELDF